MVVAAPELVGKIVWGMMYIFHQRLTQFFKRLFRFAHSIPG
jgi:hypothetical protein